MGSTESRRRLQKVAPCCTLQEKGHMPKAQWTLPALPLTAQRPSESLGRRRTIVPPLKQEMILLSVSG